MSGESMSHSSAESRGTMPNVGTRHTALVDHPNQLPESYVRRIIETFSNAGDRVLVMFGGSGTETFIAHAMGRDVTAIELGELECQSIVKRLERGPVRLERPPAE